MPAKMSTIGIGDMESLVCTPSAVVDLYALSGGGSVSVCWEEDSSSSFSFLSASSSLSSSMMVFLAFGLTGGSYVLPMRVNTTFTCSCQVCGG
ncbi:hypothetical protein Tco_1195365 [Tanacetum coccineum]